ncbi:MAG: hypothetical protein ACYC61_23195 [Isosphaeraceae bacterium]
MPSQSRNMPEQEHSIKVRSNELFIADAPTEAPRTTRPFPQYLRETPAQPLSAGLKAIIWTLAIIVALLFVTALWRVVNRHATRPSARGPAARSAWSHGQSPSHRPAAPSRKAFST